MNDSRDRRQQKEKRRRKWETGREAGIWVSNVEACIGIELHKFQVYFTLSINCLV